MSERSNTLDQPTPYEDDCEALRALIPAYTLGAADPDERALVERKLPECPDVAAELAEYHALSESLLFSAPPVVPSPHVLTNLLAATAPAKSLDSAPGLWERISGLVTGRQPRLGVALVAAVIIVLLATNVYWFVRLQQLEDDQAALSIRVREQETLLGLVGERGSNNWVSLASTQSDQPSYAVLVWTRAEEDPNTWVALLNAKHMPALAPDRAYQLWLVRDETRVSAGLFRVNADGEGMLIFRTTVPIGEYQRFGITQEPAGGSEWPTSSPVVSGQT